MDEATPSKPVSSAVAALTMYTQPSSVSAAYSTLTHLVAQKLSVPLNSHFPPAQDLPSLWRHPNLLLAQTCGYPLTTSLRGQVALVGVPRYTFDGCGGDGDGDEDDGDDDDWGGLPTHCAFIIVSNQDSSSSSSSSSKEKKFTNLESLRGARAAVNSWDSNSGMNLFRHAIAPLMAAQPQPQQREDQKSSSSSFFSQVLETGGHVRSIELVSNGTVDVASIDCVTFGYLQRDAPEIVARVRVLARTRRSLCLPFVTSVSKSDGEVRAIREALREVLRENVELAKVLGMEGLVEVEVEEYERVVQWEREAEGLGYPVLA